jgi:hypothetical protein
MPIRPAADPAPNGNQTNDADNTAKAGSSLSQSLRTVAGLLAVIAGVIVVAVIAGAAISKNSQTAATIAASTTGAVATMVGAYFGVKVGTDQAKQALDAGTDQAKRALDAADQRAKEAKQQSAQAQVFAAHLPEAKADDVLRQAGKAAQDAAA